MKNLIAFVIAMFTFVSCIIAQNPNHVYVNGYTRSNGTYVEGHYRTAPNNTINDNFSTYPNVNPYTGAQGTTAPCYSYIYTNSNNNSNSYSNTYSNSYTQTTYTPTYYTTYRTW